ncbi:MAG: tetratricopeptide repeat protein, partial [Phycisphaeraceae bacterium]|nr:tetratricopeptide repeat protein [Phycisphaeraceae bacterium]
FLDVMRDPQAAAFWSHLADAHPDDPMLQRQVLSARSTWADRSLIERTIQRLQAAASDREVEWKVARSRLLIFNGNPDDLQKALSLLRPVVKQAPYRTRPRLLLATVLQRQGDFDGAAAQLKILKGLRPQDSQVVLDLAELRLAQGDRHRAEQLIDRLLNKPHVPAADRYRSAMLLARLGRFDRALAICEKTFGSLEHVPATPALARWLIRLNRSAEAEAVYRRLMKRPSPRVITAYVRFLLSRNRRAEAQDLISGLNDLAVSKATRARVHAAYQRLLVELETDQEARFRRIQLAIDAYRRVLSLEPADRATCYRLIDFNLRFLNISEALDVARDAPEPLKQDAVIRFLTERRKLIQEAGGGRLTRLILTEMLAHPDRIDPLAEGLGWIGQVLSDRRQRGPAVAAVEKLIGREPASVALGLLQVELYTLNRQPNKAVMQMRRLVRLEPDRSDLRLRLIRLLERYRRWEEMRDAARQWKRLSLKDLLPAEVLAAKALLRMGRAHQAVERLQPAESRLAAEPQRHFEAMAVYVEALILAGRIDRAASLLWPLLGQETRWRRLAMTAATDWIRAPDVSARWLRRVAKARSNASAADQMAMDFQWVALGDREDLQAEVAAAEARLRNRAEDPNASAAFLSRWGTFAMQKGRRPEALAAFRRAVEKDPGQTVALNNMAVLLSDSPSQRAAALVHVLRAIEIESRRWDSQRLASFHDTAAMVLMRLNRYDRAVEHLERAVGLAPKNVAWTVALAEALLAKGDRLKASNRFDQIRLKLLAAESTPQGLRDRIDRLAVSLGRRSPVRR